MDVSTSASHVRIAVRRGIRDAIYDHIYADLGHEVGGVLVGHYALAKAQTVVTSIIPALKASGSRASLTFTHDAWEEIHKQLDRLGNGEIVGWYHSHPGFGVFLSTHDTFIHENFFSGSRQVAFVVDPYSAREGWFGWRDGKVAPVSPELDSQRPPQRPDVGRPPDQRQREARNVVRWGHRAAYGLLGVAVGVAFWVALLRPGTTVSPHTSTYPVRSHRSPAHSRRQAVQSQTKLTSTNAGSGG